MCCELTGSLDLPPEVIEALASYRLMLAERPYDWGDERADVFRVFRYMRHGPVMEQFGETGSWDKAVAAAIADRLPTGFVLVRIDSDGNVSHLCGPPRLAIAGRSVRIDVVIDSSSDSAVMLRVGDRQIDVPPRGGAIEAVRVDGSEPVVVVDDLHITNAVRVVEGAELELESPHCARWSVTDESGGAWFPDGVLEKWDFHGRPFFHGHGISMRVPSGTLDVWCNRGMEFERQRHEIVATPGETVTVEGDPKRLYDPAANGWYGGDMHVHMNYSGDLICTPGDAALMQFGEGLHVVNLVAANCTTSLIYDCDMLERYPGVLLPWSTEETVAQMGVEYRNDLLGHVHALGPSGPPSRYCTGHERSDNEDWPPNSAGIEELRSLGATVGYCHPAFQEFPEDGSTRRFFRVPRSVEARELVADAALGLIDSVDLISPANSEGSMFLYHRLLSCGHRLAATAGTDVFLSFSHSSTFSNPPGFGRVYANLDGRALTVENFKDAIRASRTVVTNGPWISLDVDGSGPGSVVDVAHGSSVRVIARVVGNGVDRLSLVGPDGDYASTTEGELTFQLVADRGPSWIAAVARGAGHPDVLGPNVFAHTSPVFVDVGGERIARAADAQWCLDFLDSLESLVRDHGHYAPETRDAHISDVVAVLDRAREFYRAIAG